MATRLPRPLNLRIATLDPNAPKSKKDCKTCNRRRIRCDRSLPTCQKCGIRSLECPGYDLKLKWDQGVASRGRLAGKALPILEHDEAPHYSRTGDVSRVQADVEECRRKPPAPELNYEDVDTSGEVSTSMVVQAASQSHRWAVDDSCSPEPTYHIKVSTMLDMHPELHGLEMKELLHHYEHNLASTFVWVDSFNNPWRKVILPLAQEQQSLLLSVLALAAEHLSQRSPDDSLRKTKLQFDACRFRDRSLKLLACQLKHEIQERDEKQHEKQVERTNTSAQATSIKSILATMLTLCQLEMVHSESRVWKVHLQASHTMIQRWLLTPSRIDMDDPDNKFLIKETFTINVFAATSSFADSEEALAFEDVDDHTLFSGFMTVIHRITTLERKMASGKLNLTPELPDLERNLELARNSTLLNYDKLLPKAARHDFDRVVDIYHYAGIIYAYQALAGSEIAQQAIRPRLDLLLRTLHHLPANGPFAQDLAWPLFIASAECREREHERYWLRQKMEDSADATGFGSCHQAWEFLRKWWDQDEEAQCCSSWIGYARARSQRGHTFLVF